MKALNKLSHLLDNQLLENFSSVIQREREAIIDVIVHLAEIAKKKLYAKEVLRHQFPHGKLEDIFNEALEALLEKKDPMRKIARRSMKKETKTHREDTNKKQEKSQIKTRYIPEQVCLEFWERDAGQCSYISPDGKRCSEHGFLELDHKIPWSLGGHSSVENLQLLCRSHNTWRVGFMK